MSSTISSGECTWRCPVVGTRISFSSSTPLPFRNAIDHENTRIDHCIGRTVKRAVAVGFCRASDFGTSSPTMTASVVRQSRTTTAAVDSAVAACIGPNRSSRGASRGASVACPYAPRIRLDRVMPTCDAAMYRSSSFGSSSTGSIRAARTLPSSAIRRSRLRRALTAANSAAT